MQTSVPLSPFFPLSESPRVLFASITSLDVPGSMVPKIVNHKQSFSAYDAQIKFPKCLIIFVVIFSLPLLRCLDVWRSTKQRLNQQNKDLNECSEGQRYHNLPYFLLLIRYSRKALLDPTDLYFRSTTVIIFRQPECNDKRFAHTWECVKTPHVYIYIHVSEVTHDVARYIFAFSSQSPGSGWTRVSQSKG